MKRLQRTLLNQALDRWEISLQVLIPIRIQWDLARLRQRSVEPQLGERLRQHYIETLQAESSDATALSSLLQQRELRTGGDSEGGPFGVVLPAQSVERAVGRFQDWLESPAWRDMHPVEKLVLGQLRLLEIWPLKEGNEGFVSVWLAGVAYRSQLLPPAPALDWVGYFEEAVRKGFQMDTSNLHTFHLESCVRAFQIALG